MKIASLLHPRSDSFSLILPPKTTGTWIIAGHRAGTQTWEPAYIPVTWGAAQEATCRKTLDIVSASKT